MILEIDHVIGQNSKADNPINAKEYTHIYLINVYIPLRQSEMLPEILRIY